MAEDAAVVETPVAPVAPPAETPAAPVAPPAPDPTDRHAVVEHAFKHPTARGKHAAFQPREQGKFAGPPAPAPVVPAPVIPAPARPAMPKAYKLDLQKHWEAIPHEFAAAVHQRELDAEKGIVPLKQRAQEADELLNEFKPYEMLLKAEGSTPKQAIASLLQTAAIFRTGTPLQKLQQVAGIMQTYGIQFQHLQQMLSGQGPQPAMDQQYNTLFQEVNQLKQSLSQQQLQREQQNETRSIAAIQAFAANPEHAHFEAVQDRMLALLQYPQALPVDVSAMPDQEKLKVAYDAAIRLDPALYAVVQAAQQAAQQAKTQAAQAKAAAALTVTGAPPSGPAPAVNNNDRRAVIANALRRA